MHSEWVQTRGAENKKHRTIIINEQILGAFFGASKNSISKWCSGLCKTQTKIIVLNIPWNCGIMMCVCFRSICFFVLFVRFVLSQSISSVYLFSIIFIMALNLYRMHACVRMCVRFVFFFFFLFIFVRFRLDTKRAIILTIMVNTRLTYCLLTFSIFYYI